MSGLSPFTRKFLAIALLFFTIYAVIFGVFRPIASLVGNSLNDLQNTHFAWQRLIAIQNSPTPQPATNQLGDNLLFIAPDKETAQQQLQQQLEGAILAMGEGVAIEHIAVTPDDNPDIIKLSMAITGEDSIIMAFIHQMESGAPFMRLHQWQIEKITNGEKLGQVQLYAEVVAAWKTA